MPTPERLGKYLVRGRLGAGAMGVVYEGFDPLIERSVALKVIRQGDLDAAQAAELRARLKREAQAAGRLSHPGIVAVYEYGEGESGEGPFIAMEMVRGRELKDLLDAGRRFTPAETARLMRGVLAALQHAHAHGVVHRDIKPSNVFLLSDGTVKVADFGVARIESSDLTQTGTVIGTPSYMSPEQLMGLPIDGRSDLFSCGVLLYQLLTGEKPFTGSITTVMHKVLHEEPAPPSARDGQLVPLWDGVVQRALAKKPEDRFASADEFARAMARALEGMPAEAETTLIVPKTRPMPPPSPPPAPPEPPAPQAAPPAPSVAPTGAAPVRRPWAAVAAAAALAGLAGGGAWWWSGRDRTPPAPAVTAAAPSPTPVTTAPPAPAVAEVPAPTPTPSPTPTPTPAAAPTPKAAVAPPPAAAPKPAPTATPAPTPAPTAAPVAAPPGPDVWQVQRDRVEAARGAQTLGESLRVLLDVGNGEGRRLLAELDQLVASLPAHSAFAVGVRDGHMRWRFQWALPDAATAARTALQRCNDDDRGACRVVHQDGQFRKADFLESVRALGAKDVATVRAATLRTLSTNLATWRERVAVPTPAPAAAAAPAPAPAATPALAPARPADAGEWAKAQATLRASPGPRSLGDALAAMLGAQGDAELDAIRRFESGIKRLRWSAALAMGERNGIVVYSYAHGESRESYARERALTACGGIASAPCQVVYANGDVRNAELATLAQQLAGRPQASVRRAFVESANRTLARGL